MVNKKIKIKVKIGSKMIEGEDIVEVENPEVPLVPPVELLEPPVEPPVEPVELPVEPPVEPPVVGPVDPPDDVDVVVEGTIDEGKVL